MGNSIEGRAEFEEKYVVVGYSDDKWPKEILKGFRFPINDEEAERVPVFNSVGEAERYVRQNIDYAVANDISLAKITPLTDNPFSETRFKEPVKTLALGADMAWAVASIR